MIIRRRRRMIAMMLAASAALLSACGTGSSTSGGGGHGQVIVYDGGGTWGSAQEQAYFKPFEKATGIKVVEAPAPSPAEVQTAISSGSPGIDVYDLSGTDLGTWQEQHLIQRIDYSGWSSGQRAQFTPYPTLIDAVPSLIFATQIAYAKSAHGAIVNWADFFDTTKFPGKRSLGDVADNISASTIEAALLASGVSPKSLYPLDINRAFNELDKIKPSILNFWTTGAQSIQLLTDGQVSAVGAWNGRVSSALDEGAKLQSTWNQAILENDYWVIPEGTKNTGNANKFIQFASRPDRQAAFAKLIAYAPTNKAAYASIPQQRQALLPTSPDHVAQTIASNNAFWSSKAPDGKPWSVEIVNRWQSWLAR